LFCLGKKSKRPNTITWELKDRKKNTGNKKKLVVPKVGVAAFGYDKKLPAPLNISYP